MPYPERERRFPLSPEANELKQDLIRRTWLPTRLEVFPQGTHPSTSPIFSSFLISDLSKWGPRSPRGDVPATARPGEGWRAAAPAWPRAASAGDAEMLWCWDAARPAQSSPLSPGGRTHASTARLPTLRSSSQTLLSLSQIPFNTLFTFRRLFSCLPSRWPGARSSGRRGADQGWLLFEGTVVLPAPGAALSKMVMLDAVTRRNPQPALWVCRPRPSICFLLVLPGPQKHRGDKPGLWPPHHSPPLPSSLATF